MNELMYRMGDDEQVPESGLQKWHNDRGLPWGSPYEGPEPVTIRRMVPAGTSQLSISVHLANEHATDSDKALYGAEIEHMHAHLVARFRLGQEHYHSAPS